MQSSQVVDAFVVVQLRELVWREEFAAGALVVGGVAAGHALGVAGGADVDGLLAEQLAEPFSGGLLVAAEEEHAVAVADDGLPRVLVHGLQLGDGLEDDTDADLARADRGDELVEVRDASHVGELIEEAVQWRGEAFAGVGAAAADDAVEQALVEDRGQKVECRVLVGQGEEDGRLFVGMLVSALVLVRVSADPVDTEVVVGEDLPDRADCQWGETHAEADDDALLGLSRALGEGPVLAGRELQALGETPCLAQVRIVVVRVLAFPFGAGLLVYFSGGPGDGVDLAFLGLVLFAGFEQVAHVGDRVEGLAGVDVQAVLEDVVGQVVDERGECGQEAAFGFGPEVVGLVLLGCGAVGVVHDVGDQAHDRHVGLVGVDVAHGVEFRLAGQVHQVELFDRVAHRL